MTDLARMTNTALQIDRAVDDAKLRALDEFATASVEEIMLQAAEKRLGVLDQRRKLVLRTFDASDVARLGEKLAMNKYAAEKLHEIFGGTFEFLKDAAGKPHMDVMIVKDDPDVGEYRVFTLFGRYTRPDGKVIEQMGSFSTKDAFFAKAHDEWKTIDDINVVDVMVAAQTETYKKCILRGIGLGYWTEDEASTLSGRISGHDFAGSQAGAGDRDAVIGFGKSKGKKPSELGDGDLAYYLKSYTENVADPARAKYLKMNQRILSALQAEVKRRETPAPAAGEAGNEAAGPQAGEHGFVSAVATSVPNAAASPEKPTTRGNKVATFWTLLTDATKADQRLAGALLRQMTSEMLGQEISSMSDLTEAHLDKLLAVPAELMAKTAATLKAKA